MNNMLNSNLLNLLAGVDKDKLEQVSNMGLSELLLVISFICSFILLPYF